MKRKAVSRHRLRKHSAAPPAHSDRLSTPVAAPPPPPQPQPSPPAAPPPPSAVPPRRQIAWGAKVSEAFRDRVIGIAAELGTDPDFLMAAMAFESGETFSPSIKCAAGSGATGLIQFMPSTATGLGTSIAVLAAMSPEEQLDYVLKYLHPYKNRIGSLEDLYMAILKPAAIGKPDSFVVFKGGTRAYEQNSGLDANKDGQVTKDEAAVHVREALIKGRTGGLLG